MGAERCRGVPKLGAERCHGDPKLGAGSAEKCQVAPDRTMVQSGFWAGYHPTLADKTEYNSNKGGHKHDDRAYDNGSFPERRCFSTATLRQGHLGQVTLLS